MNDKIIKYDIDKVSQRPWVYDPTRDHICSGGLGGARIFPPQPWPVKNAENYKHAVHCVNLNEELVEALEELLDAALLEDTFDTDAYRDAKKTLEKAKEGKSDASKA